MKKKNISLILKITIFMFVSLCIVNFVNAYCMCETDGTVSTNDCAINEQATCELYDGAYNGYCYCVPQSCSPYDGVCITSDSPNSLIQDHSGNVLFSCQETVSNAPSDCCVGRYNDVNCRDFFCGNNVINSAYGEQCDGTALNGRTCASYGLIGTLKCSSICQFDTSGCYSDCGNHIIETGEECDDGDVWNGGSNGVNRCNANDPYDTYGYDCGYCDTSCNLVEAQFCGDGITQSAHEECDDGNYDNGDACTNLCKNNVCGDGSVYSGHEVCDGGNRNGVACTPGYGSSCTYCNSDCTANLNVVDTYCGDGIIQSPNNHNQYEQCEGYNFNGASCANYYSAESGPFNNGNLFCSGCTIDTSQCSVCGDGVIAVGEQCDSGSENADNKNCKNDCTWNTCGDGKLYEGVEQCDDGNSNNNDDCLNSCRTASCGDTFLNLASPGETCDGTLFRDTCASQGYDGGPLSCSSCSSVSSSGCTCNSGRANCGPGGCTPINTVTNCGGCGVSCTYQSCGMYDDVGAECISATSCATCPAQTCSNDGVCKEAVGAYCTSANRCDNACEFNAAVTPVDCKIAELGGCKPGDKIKVTINYRGNCAPVTAIQLDMAESSVYPSTYDGSSFCNIQQDTTKSSMPSFTFNAPGLLTVQANQEFSYEFVIPENLGNGYCKNKVLKYFNVGLKGIGPSNQGIYYASNARNTVNMMLINPVCGDDDCVAIIGENTKTCFRDCFKDGWETRNNAGWSLDPADNILHANSQGLSIFTSYLVDIKADVNYTFSYDLSRNAGCSVYFDFNDGNCTSAVDSITKPCFNDLDNLLTTDANGKGYLKIKIPSNANATNGKFFRNVNLRLSTGPGCSDVSLANISLMESTFNEDFIEYNYTELYKGMPSGEIQSTGCCPENYCWDGKKCQDSFQWMSNSSLPGLWNTLNISNWTDRHINISNISNSISYRCVIDNDHNEAQWLPSRIKYDWNFKTSGYCARETDCFVNNVSPSAEGTNSQGCIHHGEVISDEYVRGQGNHYCYLGNWTTKSYIVATFLQNISEGKAYTLQCYNDTNITYNLNSRTMEKDDNILSSCVLLQKNTPTANKERIITGIVFKDISTVEGVSKVGQFIQNLSDEYKFMYGDIAITINSDCLTGGSRVPNSNFTRCIERSNPETFLGGLYVYYESEYNYLIFSDAPISGLTQETVWSKISGFFRGLFDSPIITTPFTAINHTTNYDRLYILRTTNVNVTALEEAKYDENEKGMTTILYVKYSGTFNETNPLYNETLFKTVNDTMNHRGKTAISVGVNVVNRTNPLPEQELIIKSQESSGLWRYFTSILRTR